MLRSKDQKKLVYSGLLLAVLIITALFGPIDIGSPAPDGAVIVTRVIDGDTIEITTNGIKQRVRYIGIDTPESVDPNRPDECYGREASQMNKELVLGKEVRMVKDISETDRYGRLLRYVYVGDIFVNLELVRLGYAHAATFPPDVAQADELAAAEREAREAKAGLWSDLCNYI